MSKKWLVCLHQSWLSCPREKAFPGLEPGSRSWGVFLLFRFGLVWITHVLVLQPHFFHVCVLQREKIITEAGTPHRTGLSESAFIAPLSHGQESKSFFMFCISVDFM